MSTSPQRPKNQRRAGRPPWGAVFAVLGVALALFIFGIYQLYRPQIREQSLGTRAQAAVAMLENLTGPEGAVLEGPPEITQREDGLLEVTGRYRAQRGIRAEEMLLFCNGLASPPFWNIETCTTWGSGTRDTFRITLVR